MLFRSETVMDFNNETRYDPENDYDINDYIDNKDCNFVKSVKYLDKNGRTDRTMIRIGCENETENIYKYNENGDVSSVIKKHTGSGEVISNKTYEYEYEV